MISVGSLACASETLDRTWLMASLELVPAVKLTWIVLMPAWLVELMLSIPETAPTAASIGTLIWRSTSAGSAPGYRVVIVTDGSTRLGN